MRTTEKVYLPSNAVIPPSWIRNQDDRIINLEFPSKTSNSFYIVGIEREGGLMGCSCSGFFHSGICSHIKRLRWILKKGKSTKAVSLEARLSISEEYISAIQLRILQELKEKPMTVDELESVINPVKTAGEVDRELGQRLSELYKAGWVEPTGETRLTRRGRMASVWGIS